MIDVVPCPVCGGCCYDHIGEHVRIAYQCDIHRPVVRRVEPRRPETSWGRLIDTAIGHEALAHQMRAVADDVRCTTTEDGGQRCTADAMPPHVHRIDDADLPKDESL